MVGYYYLRDLLGDTTEVVSAVNDRGEHVLTYKAEEGCYCVETAQDNGRVRKNYYWADGTREEIYE